MSGALTKCTKVAWLSAGPAHTPIARSPFSLLTVDVRAPGRCAAHRGLVIGVCRGGTEGEAETEWRVSVPLSRKRGRLEMAHIDVGGEFVGRRKPALTGRPS